MTDPRHVYTPRPSYPFGAFALVILLGGAGASLFLASLAMLAACVGATLEG